MDNIKKNRFLNFLMWAVPISFFGLPWLVVWAVVQFSKGKEEIQRNRDVKVPLLERPDIAEMNKEENLTEEDKAILAGNKYDKVGRKIKIGEGVYTYEYFKK